MNKIVIIYLFVTIFPLVAFCQPFSTQEQWELYFKNRIHDLDQIEGIWVVNNTVKVYDRQNRLRSDDYHPQINFFAIYNDGRKFNAYSFGQNTENSDSRISFKSTASAGIYLFEVNYLKSHSSAKATAKLTGFGLLELNYEVPTIEMKHRILNAGVNWIDGYKVYNELQWIKTFPAKSDYEKSGPTFGTGFGISSNGIIVTNFHIIDGAKTIKVRGLNSDFNKTYQAKLILSDKNNDLALIQIDDYGFTSLGNIPYTIKRELAGVGENIFVLGYPLRATMGDEIKLTNGIVSSRTGFQGDVTTYQISAPVQPGNSGGPLFDSQGHLIGIVNAKHGGAENASYAVKASYLTNLIDLLPSQPNLQTINSLTGKTLMQQVELAKKFVYIIEAE